MLHQGKILEMIRGRIIWMIFLIALVYVIVIGRYMQLQIFDFQHYTTISKSNIIRVKKDPVIKGVIYDTQNVPVAENTVSYSLEIIPSLAPQDPYVILKELRKYISLSMHGNERFIKSLHKYNKKKSYSPIVLKLILTQEEVNTFAVNAHKIPYASLRARLIRNYPRAKELAHVVGYVKGSFESKSLGVIGLEKRYNDEISAQPGITYVEVNAKGREVREIKRIAPSTPKNLYLHVDTRLQKVAYDAIGNRRGSVVVLDVNTGGVLAIVSRPSFDPNNFITGIDSRSYQDLIKHTGKTFFNRSISGQYSPGSVIKPIYALAALETGKVDKTETIHDKGYYRLKKHGRRYRDWKREGHGIINLSKAIEESSDIFFYILGRRLGEERMFEYGSKFGLGQNTGIDIAGESAGILPNNAWKKKHVLESWRPGDNLNMAIGQGYTLTTPLQLAMAFSIIARRGVVIRPSLVKSIGFDAIPIQIIGKIDIKEEHWDYVIQALENVVHGKKGTARGISYGLKYKVAGKTGTVQVVGLSQDDDQNKRDESNILEHHKDHALFAAFAPIHKPAIAVAVIIENGGSGSRVAAPIAKKVIQAWATYHPDQFDE